MDHKQKLFLEERLVEGRWLSEERLASAQEEAMRAGESLWVELVKLRFLSQEDIMMFFSCESGVPFVRISDYSLRDELLDVLDHAFCIQHLLLPLFKVGETLYIASCNPFDASVVDAAARMSGLNVEFLLATADSIRAAQDSRWRIDASMFAAEEFVSHTRKKLHGMTLCRKVERLPLKLDVRVLIPGEDIAFNNVACLNAVTTDITGDASAIGLEAALYLPPQLAVTIEFKLPTGPVSCEAQVLNCRMEKGCRYFAGIALTGVTDEAKTRILGSF
jgi:hypothetical protein